MRLIFPGEYVGRRSVILALIVFSSVSAISYAYAQESTPATASFQIQLLDMVASEGVALLTGVLGLGVSAFFAWLRNRGLPVSSEQEAMFRDIVSQRFQKLAKDSWSEMRNNLGKIDEYCSSLR